MNQIKKKEKTHPHPISGIKKSLTSAEFLIVPLKSRTKPHRADRRTRSEENSTFSPSSFRGGIISSNNEPALVCQQSQKKKERKKKQAHAQKEREMGKKRGKNKIKYRQREVARCYGSFEARMGVRLWRTVWRNPFHLLKGDPPPSSHCFTVSREGTQCVSTRATWRRRSARAYSFTVFTVCLHAPCTISWEIRVSLSVSFVCLSVCLLVARLRNARDRAQ